jgi:hypothetical protein
MTNRSHHKERTAHRYIVISLLFQPLKHCLMTSIRSGFRNHRILDPFCSNALITSVLFFKSFGSFNLREQIPDTSEFVFFPFYVSRIILHFISTNRTFLLFVTVAVLSIYQSHINCRNRKVDGNFAHKANYLLGFSPSGILLSFLKISPNFHSLEGIYTHTQGFKPGTG